KGTRASAEVPVERNSAPRTQHLRAGDRAPRAASRSRVAMRIGIDGRELCGRATGVGRYLAGLLRQWAAGGRACAHEFVLYAAEPVALSLDSRKFRTRVVTGSGGTWWEQIALPRETNADALDVWFAPGYTAPLRVTVPLVVSIHDLSFVAHPEWFGVR